MPTSFADFLEEVDSLEKSKKQPDLLAELTWANEAEKLFEQLARWVAESDPKKRLAVSKGSEASELAERHREPRLNKRKLTFAVGSRCVTVLQAGRQIVGLFEAPGKAPAKARGRIDMIGPLEKAFLFLLEGSSGEDYWIIRGPDSYHARLLDKEAFLEVLKRLLS